MDHTRLIHGINFWPYDQFDNKLTANFFFVYQTAMNYLKLDGYLCGGHSTYLLKLFEEHGIKAFTYNHGIEKVGYTHIVVIAEYKDNLYIFDPTYNFVYRDKEKYLRFKDVIYLVSEKKNSGKYIKIINPEDKIYNLMSKEYEKYTPFQILEDFNRGKFLVNKDNRHILLNGSGAYAGSGKMEYFFQKYPFLKSLIQQ